MGEQTSTGRSTAEEVIGGADLEQYGHEALDNLATLTGATLGELPAPKVGT